MGEKARKKKDEAPERRHGKEKTREGHTQGFKTQNKNVGEEKGEKDVSFT